MKARRVKETTTAEKQLAAFIAKFAPANQRLIRALRASLRKRLPGAHELVYDNYNFLVIAYSPTEKTGDSCFSIGADKHGASLFFGYNGTRIEDPKKLLQGTGARNRFLRLVSAVTLSEPAVSALIDSALALSKPMPAGHGATVIRSISARQRPRR